MFFVGVGVRLDPMRSRRSARREQPLRELASELQKSDGTKVAVVVCDLAQLDALPGVYEQAKKAFGRVDVLVNNGGVSIRAESTDSIMSRACAVALVALAAV